MQICWHFTFPLLVVRKLGECRNALSALRVTGGFGELSCRTFVTVDPSLAFATVMPVKSRASIDSQFLAANGRIVTLLGNLGKDAWVRTVIIDRNSLQPDFTEGAERPAQ